MKTNFLGNDMSNENMHYTCIACITIDFVIRTDKKKSSTSLEECKYRAKKIQKSRFIITGLKSDSDSDSSDLDSEKMGAKVNNKLMAKLESASDSE